MGNSRWSGDDYTTYAQTTNYRTASREQVFTQRSVNEKLDPRNVKVGKGPRVGQQLRESMISEENPNPTPIILGLDVTGSMGAVAHQIAVDELPKLMTEIHSTGVVSDPHVMFMGIDDVFAQGHGALQTSYFEPDLRIVERFFDRVEEVGCEARWGAAGQRRAADRVWRRHAIKRIEISLVTRGCGQRGGHFASVG